MVVGLQSVAYLNFLYGCIAVAVFAMGPQLSNLRQAWFQFYAVMPVPFSNLYCAFGTGSGVMARLLNTTQCPNDLADIFHFSHFTKMVVICRIFWLWGETRVVTRLVYFFVTPLLLSSQPSFFCDRRTIHIIPAVPRHCFWEYGSIRVPVMIFVPQNDFVHKSLIHVRFVRRKHTCCTPTPQSWCMYPSYLGVLPHLFAMLR